MQTYSNSRLYGIAKDNYVLLTKYCNTLVEEGYWERPESVLHKPMSDVLDMYVQSVLINLAVFCNKFNEDIRNFIITIPEKNSISYPLLEEPSDDILYQAKKIRNAPPIILQLCGLRDKEKHTNLTVVFFDAMLNILLAMSYLNNAKDMSIMKYIQDYYRHVSAFLDSSNKNDFKIDDKYIFRKICDDQLEISHELLKSNNGDIQNYIKNTVRKKKNIKEYVEIIEKNKESNEKNKVEEQEKTQVDIDNNDDLSTLLLQLGELVGLSKVKDEISSLINLIKVRKLRESYNMPQMDMSFHMVFTGNPGTGKTTVARLIARIYKELGILSEGNLIETDRAGLVAGYVGQTALKVKEVVEKAIGGVLFIDEAYTLSNSAGNNDFGNEAIDTLVKMMEDNRDNLVVIVAGYHKEMQNFLKSNTGLISRFNKFIEFSDYTTEELIDILNSMAGKTDMILCEAAIVDINNKLIEMTKTKINTFGNARGIRNVFEKIVVNQANRIVTINNPTKEMLTQIVLEDVIGVI